MSENINGEVLLRVDHLSQYFKSNKAVDDISFDVMKGEVFGLVGESGCGKTTTGRSIIKLYDITSGSIYFKDQRICAGTLSYKKAIAEAKENARLEIAALKEAMKKDPSLAEKNNALIKQKLEEQNELITRMKAEIKRADYDQKHSDKEYAQTLVDKVNAEYKAKLSEPGLSGDASTELRRRYRDELRIAKKTKLITKIQMIFQDPIASLNPRMTVKEIISEGLIINGIKDKKYIEDKVYEILEFVGLVREHAGRYPHEFSGGQRQRIGVARSVIMRPDLIIADEPVSALDVSIQAQVINLLNDLRHELGLTIIFIAHDLSVVKYFSDRIAVMYYGKIVELATSDELFKKPLHPYTKSLLSAIPLPDPQYEKKRKRIIYNPLIDHDYSKEQPEMLEVEPGHFVRCNTDEYEKYKSELKANEASE